MIASFRLLETGVGGLVTLHFTKDCRPILDGRAKNERYFSNNIKSQVYVMFLAVDAS